jgi:Transposase
VSGNKQRRLTDEFKREAVRLTMTSGRSVERVANDLGIAKSTLSRWGSERDHTRLDGYAALQVYSGGNRLSVAVSDSGLGIMGTLRPSLATEFPKLAGLPDTDLLVEVFRQGPSRHGLDRGCGLKGCAAKAIKFGANLDVRLPNQRVLLTPARGTYQPNNLINRNS